jgi:hypothetical protein
MRADAIEVDGDLAGLATRLEPAILDPAIATLHYMSRYHWFVRHILERDSVFLPIRRFVGMLRRVGVLEGGA